MGDAGANLRSPSPRYESLERAFCAYDVRNAVNVNPSRRDIGCDKMAYAQSVSGQPERKSIVVDGLKPVGSGPSLRAILI
jgi:hypothetical protein